MVRIVRTLLTVLGAFTAAALPACAGVQGAAGLQGTWKLAEIKSQPVRPPAGGKLPAFTIKNQLIEGFDGCNDFSGRLDQPGSITSTRRGCSERTLMLPLDLSDPMSHLRGATIDKQRLILPERGTLPASVFERTD
jgi:heat shock protein HslJ